MASFLSLLLFSLISVTFSLSKAFELPPPKAFHLPIRKDPKTLQYYTSIDMAMQNLDVVIDLGGQLLWFNCDGYNYHRPTARSPAARTGANPLRAPAAWAATCPPCQGAPTTHVGPMPTILTRTCSMQIEGFGQDKMGTLSTDGQFVLFNFDHPKFPFSCANFALLKGLASGTKGMIGLARTKTSLHKQLSLAFKLPHKFALCIPSSSEEGLGDIYIGGGPYYMPPAIGDFSKSLTSTPLIINTASCAGYY